MSLINEFEPLMDEFEEVFLKRFDGLETIAEAENYMRKNREAINPLCDHNSEITEYIKERIGKLIIKEVRENYYEKLVHGRNPEYLSHPEYFAYALLNKTFLSYELRRINFENDHIINAFITNYLDTKLLKNFVEKKLSP